MILKQRYINRGISRRMQNIQGSAKLTPIEDNDMVESRPGKRADRARRWPAMLISMMIVVPMIVVLGFYATISAQAAGPLAVDLGTASDFVILAKTGITSTGTTAITGDIGVSPAPATAMTGFDLILDASGTFSTSALVTGNVYASDYTDPTPTKMTTAVSDMETAYTDAAGRTPDSTELYAGDLTGQTLTPGCYVWSTGVLISAAGVTISGARSEERRVGKECRSRWSP